MARFKVAALQMRSGTDPEPNIAAFEALVREAAAAGAVYVQSPEMSGAIQRDRRALRAVLRSQDEDGLARTAARLAGELGIHVHIGSTAIATSDGKIANRAFLFDPAGRLVTTYDKIHMFDVDLDNGESWRESAAYTPGTETVVADIGHAMTGLSVCYDLRFPHLFRAQAMAGAQMLTVPAAFTRQTGEAHWHVLLRARAIENGAWVVAAAQGGTHEDGRETFGHSLIVDPWGRIVADKGDAEPGVVVAEIDTDAVGAARAKIPNLKNARQFSVRVATAEGSEERAAS